MSHIRSRLNSNGERLIRRFGSDCERALALSEFNSKHLAMVLLEVSAIGEVKELFTEFCQMLDPIIAVTDAETQGRLCDVVLVARALARFPVSDVEACTLADEKPEVLAALLAIAARYGAGDEYNSFTSRVESYAQTFTRLMSVADGETSETAAKVIAISELLPEWVRAGNGDE